jgi:hypothetical protein
MAVAGLLYFAYFSIKAQRNLLGELCVTGRIILKCTLKKYGSKMWIRFMWLEILSSGGLLLTW